MMAVVVEQEVCGFPRLAWYEGENHSWDVFWAGLEPDDLVSHVVARPGLLSLFRRHLPKGGRVLDAGCGLGQWVIVLRQLGYDVHGVDTNEYVVRKLKERLPDARVELGDVSDLHYPEGYFSAYYSLGVLDHIEEGPQAALREAHRVLSLDGVLICAVTHFNLVRRFRPRVQQPLPNHHFYHWAFLAREVQKMLNAAGFRVVERRPYNVMKTLTDEFGLVKKAAGAYGPKQKAMSERRPSRAWWNLLNTHVLESSLLRHFGGNMIAFVARKK